jgi:hypothetical protein
MENQESKQEGEKSCGCGSGASCCCLKALLAVLLFLVGGIIGFLMGGRCCSRQMKMCPLMPPAMESGAAPAKGK